MKQRKKKWMCYKNQDSKACFLWKDNIFIKFFDYTDLIKTNKFDMIATNVIFGEMLAETVKEKDIYYIQISDIFPFLELSKRWHITSALIKKLLKIQPNWLPELRIINTNDIRKFSKKVKFSAWTAIKDSTHVFEINVWDENNFKQRYEESETKIDKDIKKIEEELKEAKDFQTFMKAFWRMFLIKTTRWMIPEDCFAKKWMNPLIVDNFTPLTFCHQLIEFSNYYLSEVEDKNIKNMIEENIRISIKISEMIKKAKTLQEDDNKRLYQWKKWVVEYEEELKELSEFENETAYLLLLADLFSNFKWDKTKLSGAFNIAQIQSLNSEVILKNKFKLYRKDKRKAGESGFKYLKKKWQEDKEKEKRNNEIKLEEEKRRKQGQL